MDVERMDGRLALVTGAGSGIGRETALLCARRGANLALCDVDEAGLAATERDARRLGRDVLARRVDVGDRAQMQEFADAVHERAGVVDLLINNAGVGLGAGFLETPLADWDWVGPAVAQRERVVRLYQRRNYGPDRVAQRILHAVQRNRPVMPVTAEAWGMWWLVRFAPSLARGVARAIDAGAR